MPWLKVKVKVKVNGGGDSDRVNRVKSQEEAEYLK